MNKKLAIQAAALAAIVSLAGCAAVSPAPDYDAMLQSVLKASFRDQGIA